MKYSLQKRISAFVLAFALVMTTAFNSIGATTKADAAAKVKTLYLTKKTTSLVEGETGTAQWAVRATKATKALAAVKVTTSDSSVVKITKTTQSKKAGKTAKAAKKNKGTVKFEAVSAGTATIKIVTKKKTKKTKSFKVTVTAKSTPASSETPATTQASASGDSSSNASGSAVTSVKIDNTTPKVGDTLTAIGAPADGTNASYTWKADGEVIEGATSATFTVTDAQFGKKITVTVSAGGASATSPETAAVAAAEVAELKLEAKQTGASTFELKANTVLTNDDAITVTRGTTEQTITKAFGADGKTVVLTTATAITASSYVIKVVPKDTKIKEASVTVTGEKSALKEIKFESDKLVLISNAGSAGTVVVNGYDQFGSKVAISASNTQFYATGAKSAYDSDSGVLTLTQSGGAFPFTVGNTVAVTVVYQNGATVIQQQATLTVSATAYVKTLEFGELASTNKDYAGKKLTITRLADNSYYYTIKKAQNQYDQDLTKKALNDMVTAGTLIISPTNTGYACIDGFDTLSDGTLIAKIKKGTATTVPTTVPLSLTSVGGGTFTQNLEIADDPYIASLDVNIPETYGNGKVEVSVTAKDQDGADYDFYNGISTVTDAASTQNVVFGDANHLTNQGSVLDATTGSFSILKDTTNKTVKIFYQYGSNPATVSTDTVSVKTAVPNVTSIKVTANPSGSLEKVQGLAGGVKTSLNANESISLGSGKEKNVVFLDNYGAAMTNAPVAFSSAVPSGTNTSGSSTSYKYTVSVNNVIDNDGTIDWNTYKEATAATKDLTITLYKVVDNGTGAGDLTVTKVNDVTVKISFAAPTTTYKATLTSSENLLYVAASSTDTATIKVEEIVNGGAPNPLTAGTGYTLEDDLGLIYNNTIKADNIGDLADGTTGKDNIYVKVAGNVVASVVLDYSNVAPTAASVSWTKAVAGNTTAADDAITIAATKYDVADGAFTIGVAPSSVYLLKILDQYGVAVKTGVSIDLNGTNISTDASNATDALLTGGETNKVTISKGEVKKVVTIINN